MLNVSRRNVQRARKVIESGDQEIIAKVDHGEVPVSRAAAGLPALEIVHSEGLPSPTPDTLTG